MSPRIEPVQPPYDSETGHQLARMMPDGISPILLFRTFVKNRSMTAALTGWGGYELSADLSLALRDREILIDRTCVLCGCEYEWGVHVAFFGEAAGLTRDQIVSLTHGSPNDGCWTDERDRLLVTAADALHDTASLDDALYERLASAFSESELLDLMLLCGWYHAISYAANGSRVDLEAGTPRFADYLADSKALENQA